MKRKPRSPKERLFDRKGLVISALQGTVAFAAVMGVHAAALALGQSRGEARALAFITLIVSNLCLILTNRSWSRTVFSSLGSKNPALFWVVGGALAFLGFVVFVPGLRGLFHFDPVHPLDIAIALGAGLVSIAWFEAAKLLARARSRSLTRTG